MRKFLFMLLLSYASLFAFEELTVQNFDDKIKGKNVIVDIYATWCPPCKIVAQNLEEFDVIKPDNVEVYKVNFEEQADIAHKYGVKSLPTLLFFKDGKLVDGHVGIVSSEKLLEASKSNFN